MPEHSQDHAALLAKTKKLHPNQLALVGPNGEVTAHTIQKGPKAELVRPDMKGFTEAGAGGLVLPDKAKLADGLYSPDGVDPRAALSAIVTPEEKKDLATPDRTIVR